MESKREILDAVEAESEAEAVEILGEQAEEFARGGWDDEAERAKKRLNQLDVTVAEENAPADVEALSDVDTDDVEALIDRFNELYERREAFKRQGWEQNAERADEKMKAITSALEDAKDTDGVELIDPAPASLIDTSG